MSSSSSEEDWSDIEQDENIPSNTRSSSSVGEELPDLEQNDDPMSAEQNNEDLAENIREDGEELPSLPPSPATPSTPRQQELNNQEPVEIEVEIHDGPSSSAGRRTSEVRGFRVDGSGAVVFDFGSDDDDEEDDPDYIPDVPPPPAIPFVSHQLSAAQLASPEFSFIPLAMRNAANTANRRRSQVAAVQLIESNLDTEEPAGPRNRRKQKKPKKKIVKKVVTPKISKPRTPSKPLKPKIIYEDLFGNEDLEVYRQKISTETKHKIVINYGAADLLHDSDKMNLSITAAAKKKPEIGYKIGEIFLQDVGTNPWTFRSNEELLKELPNLAEFTIHVSDMPTLSVIKLKTEEWASEEESASRKRPMGLARSDAERPLIFVTNRHYFYHFDPVDISSEMFSNKGLGSKKYFRLDFIGFDEGTKNLQFDVMLLESVIVGDHDIGSIPSAQGQGVLNIFSYCFKVEQPPKPMDEETKQKEDIAWFYGQLKKYHIQEVLPEPDFSIQPSCLVPILRSYQKDAVKWMLFREGVLNSSRANPQPSSSKAVHLDLIETFLQKMYTPVEIEISVDEALELKPAFYNPYTGYVCWSKPTVSNVTTGGILADEMGLGKTVEVLSLILLNQKPAEKNELAEYEDESEEEKITSEYESSDSEHEVTAKGRKRSAKGKSRKSRKRTKRLNSDKIDEKSSESLPLRHPRLRKRKLSPCEFASVSFDNEQFEEKAELIDKDSTADDDKNDSDPDFEEEHIQELPVAPAKKKGGRKANSSKEKTQEVNLRHPKLSRRRMSPCEFTLNSPNVSEPDVEKPGKRATRRAKQAATNVISQIVERENIQAASVNSSPSSSSPKKGRKKSTTVEIVGDKPKSTYEGIKQIYDEALRGYSEAGEAKVVPRFHGTFFETSIRRRALFECICGGYNDDDQRWVVTCTTCDSSQHAECVGFDKHLEKRMLRENKSYLCPHCAVMEKPYPAKTTLIITPNSISYQWINEIQRHVKNHQLNILFYKGVTTHGYIPPAKLATYDIIITTYTTLSMELNYVDLPHCNSEDGRRFRNAKRFLTIPSPLPCVLYWRVCLDEAQMVEGINTKMSLMAMKIQAIHRWCVTGTPINKGLQDLFGLFAFLGVQPISIDYWWEKLVQDPFHRKDVSLLYEIFGQLIWRTSKPDVLDQLGIPPQTEKSHWLTFSPVETHFYKQQYEICSNKILGKIARLRQTTSQSILDSRLSNLDRATLHSLLQPFLELRQACCSPQMVKGQFISLQKGTLTMEELLAQLVKKTSLQCADDHRLVVAALNGMAGIHWLREDWFAASEKYREVLRSAEKNKPHFRTDSLQILHTLENLADLLDRHHDGVPFTLRDDCLRKEAEELKKKYLEKYAVGVKAAKDAVAPLTQTAEDLFEKFECVEQSWWAETLFKAAQLSKIDDLIFRIKDELIEKTKKKNHIITLGNKFNDASGLQQVLIKTITEMVNLRQDVLKGLEELQNEEPSTFVHGAVACHLRKRLESYYKDDEETGFRCKLCQDHGKFLQYESILFQEEKKNKVFRTGRKWQQQKLMGVMAEDLTEEEKNLALLKEEEELLESLEHVNVGISDVQRRGTWADSDTEKILKLINNFSRLNGLSSQVINDGSTHIKLFEAMKKEFRVMRILWRQIYDQVSAVDELSQATTRLRLRGSGEDPVAGSSRPTIKKPKELKSGTSEDVQKIQNIHVLEPHELETKLAQMQLEIDKGNDGLSIHMGQLLYLDTLKKNGYGKKGTSNADDCPVCQNQLGMEWSVLKCGHSFCGECVKKMCPNTLHTFLCPLCRQSMKYADVSFVDTREPENSAVLDKETLVNKKEIRGSHSTKVEAIIGTLLGLQETHPGEKVIIFSTWVDVLEIIAKALDQNDISNCLLNKPGKHFQTNLQRFKTRENVQVLLMPISNGSKGLNIVEASHVLLVEPILNLASELQAIGRVHRIGQTKSTCVHRFYVKKTIEEQLFEILRTHDVSSDDEGALTVADLRNLVRSVQYTS